MNVEKRIQRLELQNERLKLALIGIGTIIVLTFVVVLKSSVDKPDEAAKKVNTPNLVIAESAVTQNAQDLIMEGESEIVRTKKVKFIDTEINSEIIKKTNLFCDEVHQTLLGNELTAKIIFENLLYNSSKLRTIYKDSTN